MSKVIGIDLGTTNSCVAVVEGGKPVVITNAEGERTTPSVVAFTKDGERLVGGAAKRQIATNSGRTVTSIKRHMGSDYRVHIDGKDLTPQEISAMILAKIRRDAESYLGEPVTEAVIRLLRRQPAQGHPGRRTHRGPERAAHHQRADGCRCGLRPGQRSTPEDPGV